MSPIPVSKSADFSEWKEGFFLPLTFPFAFFYIFSLQPRRQGRGVRDRTPFTFSKHREVTKINHGNLSCLPSSLSLVRKRKERLPASLPTYILHSLVSSCSTGKKVCLQSFLASLLTIMSSFLFSSVAYILLKSVKGAGDIPFTLSLLGKFPIAGGSLSLSLFCVHIGKEERRWMNKKESCL